MCNSNLSEQINIISEAAGDIIGGLTMILVASPGIIIYIINVLYCYDCSDNKMYSLSIWSGGREHVLARGGYLLKYPFGICGELAFIGVKCLVYLAFQLALWLIVASLIMLLTMLALAVGIIRSIMVGPEKAMAEFKCS